MNEKVSYVLTGKRLQDALDQVLEVKDDLDSIIKCEVSGRCVGIETRLDGVEAQVQDLNELALCLNATNRDDISPSVRLLNTGGSYEIVQSFGVCAVTDHGVGDISIDFVTASENPHLIPRIDVDEAHVSKRVLSRNATSVRLAIVDKDDHAVDPACLNISMI